MCCPDGEIVPAGQRLAEIRDRYGPGHLVSRSVQRTTPMIPCAVEQIQGRTARATRLPRKEEGQGLNDLGLGWDRVHLARGMAPRACSNSSNYFSELEPRYGIEP